MGAPILPTFCLVLIGTSLTNGRLATPPYQWPLRLLSDMQGSPECIGPVQIINAGQGSATSTIGVGQADDFCVQRPTHVLMEDFGINDCAIGPVPLVQARGNLRSIINAFLDQNPEVIIVHQTMSSASAGDVSRSNLAAYYANGTTVANEFGLLTLNHYTNWPKPLPTGITVNGDGLHPLWEDAFVLYSYPAILAWAREAMEDFWGALNGLLTQEDQQLITEDGESILLEG